MSRGEDEYVLEGGLGRFRLNRNPGCGERGGSSCQGLGRVRDEECHT